GGIRTGELMGPSHGLNTITINGSDRHARYTNGRHSDDYATVCSGSVTKLTQNKVIPDCTRWCSLVTDVTVAQGAAPRLGAGRLRPPRPRAAASGPSGAGGRAASGSASGRRSTSPTRRRGGGPADR